MSTRTLNYRSYVGIFCLTFIITYLLLKDSRAPLPVVKTSKHLRISNDVDLEDKPELTQSKQKQGENEGGNDRGQSNQHKPNQEKKCDVGSPRYVILLTYGRSGSSLMSDIISEHPQVFSYFEPLHNLAKSFAKKQKEYRAETNTYLHLTQIPEYNSAALKMLEKQMTCNYERLNRFATLNLHAPLLESTRSLYKCVKSALTSKAEENCLLDGQEKCEAKPIRFIKTIRLSVESVTVLLDSYPCAKLIYLIRDPRGSYHSKTKMFTSHGQNVTWDAQRFCTRLNKDADAMMKLKETYPDRVHVTRFETLATHPIVSAKLIYDFIGLEFTRSIAMFVYKKTHSDQKGDAYSTNRANATETCYKWRTTIPFDHVKNFDMYCSEAYFKLGYLPSNSPRDLRDFNKTLIFHRDFS